MLSVTRFLDWLDESAAGVIRVAYLLAGVIAVASYFSDGNVPASFSHLLNAVLPWILAAALEIHTYLTARRVRAAYQGITAAALGSEEHERAERQMRLNLWILAGLLAFSIYNQLQYLASTWTPPHTPLTPPAPWAYIIRAVITPSAFMAAAFLAPLGEGMAAQIQSEAHHLTAAAFKAAAAQWKRRLREMQRSGQDITAALVELVDDPAERRVIATIHRAMHGKAPAILTAPDASEAPRIEKGEALATQPAATLAPLPGELIAAVYPPVPLVPERSTYAGALDPDPQPDPPAPRGGPRRTSERSATTRRRAPEPVIRLVSDRRRRPDAGRRSADAQARWTRHTETAAGLLALDPLMSTRELARRMSAQLGEAVGAQRATEVRRTVQPVRPTRSSAQELAQEEARA